MAFDPMMEFDSSGKAAILRYDVPSPSSYEGRTSIELKLAKELFKNVVPPTYKDFIIRNEDQIGEYLRTVSDIDFAQQLYSYCLDKIPDPEGTTLTPVQTTVPKSKGNIAYSVQTKKVEFIAAAKSMADYIQNSVKSRVAIISQPAAAQASKETAPSPEEKLAERYSLFRDRILAAMSTDGRFPVFVRSMAGMLRLSFVHIPSTPRPRLVFLETHKLTTFPGDYGAGTTVDTFTLLPGEDTQISIKTWKNSTTTCAEASSILDSYTDEKAGEFEQGVQSENSTSSSSEESFSYHAEAKASAEWGWGSAEVSGGVAGSSNSSRQESAKNVMNATEKHSQKSSAKRDINLQTSTQTTTEQGTEESVVRNIKNVNVCRTIGYDSGYPGSSREYTLYEITKLVDDVLSPEFDPAALKITLPGGVNKGENGKVATADYIKALIIQEYNNVYDYTGAVGALIEEVPFSPNAGKTYLRVIPPASDPDQKGSFKGKSSFVTRTAPQKIVQWVNGIILEYRKFTMRTSGLIVEALLGQSDALDSYALGSQNAILGSKQLENAKLLQALDIVKNTQQQGQADAFGKVMSVFQPKLETKQVQQGQGN